MKVIKGLELHMGQVYKKITVDDLKTSIEYDLHTGMYIIRTKVGDMELGTPLTLTPEEYQDYSMQESMRAYYRQKNEESFRPHHRDRIGRS